MQHAKISYLASKGDAGCKHQNGPIGHDIAHDTQSAYARAYWHWWGLVGWWCTTLPMIPTAIQIYDKFK